MAARLPKDVSRRIAREAWELRQRFKSDRQIVEILSEQFGIRLNHGTVCRMIWRQEKILAAEFVERAEEIKARQTMMLDHMARDAYAEYERSKLGSVTTKVTTDAPEGDPGDADSADRADPQPSADAKVETTTKGQTGDPALLAQARGALADIRKIWGLDSPEKKEIGGAPNRPLTLKVLKGVSLDDI